MRKQNKANRKQTKSKQSRSLRVLSPEGVFQVGLSLKGGPEDKRDAALFALELTIPMTGERLAALRVRDVLGGGGKRAATLRAKVCGETLDCPIFPAVSDALAEWVKVRGLKEDSPLFPDADGRKVDARKIGEWVKARLRKAEIEGEGFGFPTVRYTALRLLNAAAFEACNLLRWVHPNAQALRKYLGKPFTVEEMDKLENLATLMLDANKLLARAKREEAAKKRRGAKAATKRKGDA